MTRKEILEAAEKCVCGQRDEDYGKPEYCFGLIAKLWEPVIKERCVLSGGRVDVERETVVLLMILLKIARAAQNPKYLDSWVDIAGYAACGGELSSL